MQLVHNADFPPHKSSPTVVPITAARPVQGTETTWPMHAVARRLGQHHRSAKWQRDYLTALIASQNFPRPLPTMAAGQINTEISPTKSRWLAAAVQAWLDGFLPPEAVTARESEAANAAAARLDASADNLFAGSARA